MSKSVLVIDTPEDCMRCPLLTGSDECMVQDEAANFDAGTLDEVSFISIQYTDPIL